MKRAGKTHAQHSKQARLTHFLKCHQKNKMSNRRLVVILKVLIYVSTSKSASVLAENSSSSCTSVTAGRRKFKDDWCKELTWLSFD
jgi:hypothetical protein